MFRVGQRVVCIDANNGQLLIENVIYTVAGYSKLHSHGVILKEIASVPHFVGFWEHRFRAVDDNWVDELLDKLVEEIDADELVMKSR